MRETKWREMFGGLQARRLKEQEAAKKAAKKLAEKTRDQERKAKNEAEKQQMEISRSEGNKDMPLGPQLKDLTIEKEVGRLDLAQ